MSKLQLQKILFKRIFSSIAERLIICEKVKNLFYPVMMQSSLDHEQNKENGVKQKHET